MSERAGPSRPPVRVFRNLFANAYVLLPFATLCWGANSSAGKLAAAEMTPITLTFLRWVGCTLVVTVFAWPHLRADWPMLCRTWRTVALLGVTGFAMFNLTFYWALHYTSAVNVAIEQAAMPALIILANFLLFRQTVGKIQVIGILLTVAGVVITITHGEPGQLLNANLNRGDGIMLVAILLYSGYAVGLRFKPPLHWLSLMFGMSVAALLTITPFMIAEGFNQGLEWPSASGWLIVGFVVLFPSFLAQLFFMRSVELIGANRAGVFINLVPIFGAALAVLLLREPLESYHAVGLGLVMIGIGIAERFARR